MNLDTVYKALDTIESKTKAQADKLKASFDKKAKDVSEYEKTFANESKDNLVRNAESKFKNARNNFRNTCNDIVKTECEKIREFLKRAYSAPITSEHINFLNALQLRNKVNKGDIEAAKLTLAGSPMSMLSFRDLVERINKEMLYFVPEVPSLQIALDALDDYENGRYNAINNYLNVPEGTSSVSLSVELEDPFSLNPTNLRTTFIASTGRKKFENVIKPLDLV